MTNKEKFLNAKNYALFYGRDASDKLSQFDFVIVEPAGQTEDTVQRTKKSGTLVFAYLSVMEIHPSTPEFKLLKNEDFILIDGQPMINQVYGNYILDLSSRRWFGILQSKIEQLLHGLPYDGVFLDTIADVEFTDIPIAYRDLMFASAVKIVKHIRETYNTCLIIQNYGFDYLLEYTAGLIDGICWENPAFEDKNSRLRTKQIISRLQTIKKRENIQILILMENKESKKGKINKWIKYVKKIATSSGFLYYEAPFQYVGGINCP